MGTFHILNDVIFVRSDIYQLESINCFHIVFSDCSRLTRQRNVKTNNKAFKKVTDLTKNDEPFYSKNAQLKILNLR